ncbi:P-loop containing nucleoside triphosphate hydrolase protein [Aspergillus californicus]
MTLPKKTMQIAEETIATVTNISRAFTESNLDFPILSAFESKPTKVKGAILKRQILVSESLARARVSHEEMFQVDCTHRTLCHVSRESRLHTRLAEFLMLTQASATPAIPLTPTVAESAVAWSVSNANEDDSQLGLSPGTSKQNTWASSSDRSGYEIIPGQPITGIAKRLKLPAYMLGPHGVAPEFCGRENVLQQLWSTLCTQNGQDSRTEPSLRTFAISAAGGMGKTQIAVAFATKCKKMKIFDAIFWIQADDKCKLAQSFADISLHLGLEDSIGDQIVSRDLVLEWLSYPVHQVQEGVKYTPEESHTLRWLLIFDNADDLSNLPEYWPIGGGGSILITSRDPLANSQTYFKCDVGIQLGPFHHEDAASLIRTLTGYSSPKDHELSVTIAGRLDCFPLVVNQMAKTIKRRNLSLKEFLSYYEQTELRQSFNKEPIIAYPGSRGTPRTIATVWSLEDLPPPATSLLDVISFMDPDQIQESLLSPTAIGQSGDKRIFAQDYPTTLSSFVLARSELIGSSLLSRNTDSEELTTHRIIQDINRLQMSPDKFSFVFGAVCELLYEQWPFSEFDWEPSRWVKCEPIISHITYLSEIYKGTTNMSLTTATTERFARLVMDAGWYYIERGLYGISAPYFDLSEQLCSLAPQETIITLTDLCYCRAELCNTLSDAKSGLPYARQYLELAEKHDPKGWRRAQAHNMLSALFVDLCDFEDAIYHADLAIQLYENLPVPEYVGFAYINKAFGLLLSDRAEEAEKVLTNYLRGRPGQPQPEVGEPIKSV